MFTEHRILVTGGAGFIGTHLCERLLERGDEVLCVDNFYTGTRHNVQHLLNNPFFELSRHDICFPLYVEVSEIYNLACPASPIHYQFDPVQMVASCGAAGGAQEDCDLFRTAVEIKSKARLTDSASEMDIHSA